VANCGSSGDRQLSVVASTYTMPGAISGPTNACAFIGTLDDATYTIRKVNNAASYIWSVPAGATITSHPGGAGVNDTIVTVSYSGAFVSGTAISVQASGCVPSTARNLTILRVLPSTPGLISGSTNVCPYMISAQNPTGIPVTYTIRKVNNATSYVWTAPANSSITAHPGGAGVNDTIVEVTFTAAFTGGTITVSSANACGNSVSARSLALTRLTPGAPSVIDIIQTNVCPTREFTYSLAGLPSNATSVLWTVPPVATLVSGQGTASITVSYPATAVAGNVTATPYNNCANSTTRSTAIKLPACPPGFAGRSSVTEPSAQQATANKLSVTISPNPSSSYFKVQVVSPVTEKMTVRILDMQGRELKRMTMQPFEKANIGQELKAGSYILEITQGNLKTTEKLLKY